MNKREVLNSLFLLPNDDILDIMNIIIGYKERLNKSNKDTLLMRMMFASGYHSTREFYCKNQITKDQSLATALNYETNNVEDYMKLKKIFDINDEIFLNILKEIEKVKSGKYEK